MTDTLKPCPFCGGRPVLVPTYHEQFAFIKCLSCAMETNSYGSVHDAYKAWNTRTPAPAPQEAILPGNCDEMYIRSGVKTPDEFHKELASLFVANGGHFDGVNEAIRKRDGLLRAALTSQAPAAMREGVLVKRADGIKDWLYESGSTCFKDQKHLEDGTPEREYWHYGYMMALIDLLRVGEE